MENLVIGLLMTAVPLVVAGYLMLNKQPPIFRMFIALLLVGLGYLTATGAIEDIGAKVSGKPTVVVPADVTPAEAPAAEAPKAAEPAPAASAPAAETAKPAEPAP